MAYRVFDRDGGQTVRLINLQGKRARVCKPFDGAWICDPCSNPRTRYEVEHTAGWRYHAWYEVLTNEDDARTRFAKWQYANKVIAAAQELAEAERRYRLLLE